MSGKYDFDRDLYIRKLNELREPGRLLCKHDWVGDDDCVYCRNEELESQLAEKDAEIQRLKDALSILQTRPQVER